ncbi:MAG: single-stranded DNA-binding protein [Phototrophicales bacterium]|nr:MAG: single-stranded DNA-binding protein [Phototrophicales bacterium]
MAGWQQTIIVGNVGRDPETKMFPNGQMVCNFSVAVSRRWTDRSSNEQREETTWFRVACWGKQAETANQFVKKGSQIMVVGRISARAYKDNSGQPQASLELTADNFQLLGSRGDNMGGGQQGGDYSGSASDMGEIPF